MTEKEIEKYLTREVKNMGGLCIKFTSPSLVGIPDRIVLLPKGKIGFVEVKVKGKKPRLIQEKRIKDLEKLGFKCFLLDDKDQVGGIIYEIYSA